MLQSKYVNLRSGELEPIRFTLSETAPLKVRFVSSDGQPLEGVEVFPFGRRDANGDFHTVYFCSAGPIVRSSDAHGEVELPYFSAGDSASLYLRTPGSEWNTHALEIPHGRREVQLVFAKLAEGEIEIEVKDGATGKHLLVPPAIEPAGLVVVLPGGDGSADFHPFVKNIADHALEGRYAVAQPIARKWRDNQQITWPRLRNRTPGMKYATEELVGKVMADVFRKHQIDRQKIFLLAWSSGGPAAYAIALHPQSPVSGSLIAMSVFKPNELPSVENAAKRSFYLLHSPEDQVCPYRMGQAAEKALQVADARVTLVDYDGGHGWHGDVFGDIKAGFEWLERNE